MGDKEKAEAAYRRSLQLNPDYSNTYFYYGKMLSGDPKRAADMKLVLEDYLKREPRGSNAPEAQQLLRR
jgi:hypothetical protein